MWHSPSLPIPFGPSPRAPRSGLPLVLYRTSDDAFQGSFLRLLSRFILRTIRTGRAEPPPPPRARGRARASSAPLSPAPPQRLAPLGPGLHTRSGFEFAQRPVPRRSSFYSVFPFALSTVRLRILAGSQASGGGGTSEPAQGMVVQPPEPGQPEQLLTGVAMAPPAPPLGCSCRRRRGRVSLISAVTGQRTGSHRTFLVKKSILLWKEGGTLKNHV